MTVDDSAVQPTEGLSRGDHRIVLSNPTRNLSAERIVTLTEPEHTIDVSWDVQRAEQFAAGLDGVVSIGEDGRRVGYVAEITRRGRYLSPEQERRLIKEFEELAGPDENGRRVYALFVPGHGMVGALAKPDEMYELVSRLVPMRGRPRENQRYAFELSL